ALFFFFQFGASPELIAGKGDSVGSTFAKLNCIYNFPDLSAHKCPNLTASTIYLVLDLIGRSYVISKLKDYPKFQAVAIAIQRSGFKIVLLLRLVPLLPFNMLNYLMSVTPVIIWEYMLASWMGMMPITFALVYVGTTLKDLSDVTYGWGLFMITMAFLKSFMNIMVLMVRVTKVAKASLKKDLAENDTEIERMLDSQSLPIVEDP
ncbi:hypothetical protein MKX01_011522, partial [Papaver californicum]